MATFVLVHGAFQGGWVWREVAAKLRAMGHQAHTPTLTGCGHLHHHTTEGPDLRTYIRDVCDYLFFEDLSEVVLVAHSYSGLICAGVASVTPHLIRRAVFVDAIIPDSNRSFADLGGEKFQLMLENHRVGTWKVKPWPLPVFGVPEEKADWVAPRLCEFPLAAFTAPFPGEFDPKAVDTAFIACTKTQNPLVRAMAGKAKNLGWPVSELDSAHSPMNSHPLELAEMLAAAGEQA